MPTTHEQDLLVVHNVLDRDFTVLWGGQSFSVSKNGEKVYPRFIAEHMAKHMADAALFQKEAEMAKAQGVKVLKHTILNNKQMRTEVVAQILPKVYQSYLEQPKQTEQERVAQQIEEASQAYANEKIEDVGEVPNKALGVLEDGPAPAVEPPENVTSDVSIVDPKKKKPTKAQLIEDCEQLGIKLTGNESYSELIAKIQAF